MDGELSTKEASTTVVLHPYWVLLASIVLPGFGLVLCGQQKRAITMQMFMIALAFITWHLTTPGQSIVGRLAGGLFIYALSVIEAYKLACLRYAMLHSEK